MKEIVAGENEPARLELDAAVVAALAELRATVRSRAQLVWGEHCTECTYPSCYAVCAEYTPRPDLHCRRFENGIETLRAGGVPDPLLGIRFRKWGKLEAEGPTPLVSLASARRREGLHALAGRIVDHAPLSLASRGRLARAWRRAQPLLASHAAGQKSSCFVLECVGLGERSVAFTLTIVPKGREPGLFQQRVVLGRGYTRVVVPIERIASKLDLERPFLVQIEPLEESPRERFAFGLVDFVATDGRALGEVAPAPPPAAKRPAAKAKCIVWDLDNTVWTGTLGESGVAGVALKPEVVELIRALDARGILHSVASKNDTAEGLAALEHFGLSEYFLYPQIGWGPKSQSLQRVAQLLDIGLDTLAFVDDQAFERSEVGETLGCVSVFPETEIPRLGAHALFAVPVTAESGQRRLMYRQENERQIAFEQSGTADYEAFLRGSDIRLELARLGAGDVTRIFELSQRTNQVNISGARYERAQVEELLHPGERLPLVMRCLDRFGDYGVIGFALFEPKSGSVLDYFMSCRVQRKFVEHALFGHLAERAAERGAERLRVRYRRTERNQLALQLLGDLGFELVEDEPGAGWLVRALTSIPGSDIVRRIEREAVA